MEQKKIKHFMYCPWTGLGMYNGFRGNRWLKNRIKVFKQFVIPSLQVQTDKNFTLWCSWRIQERKNPYVKELIEWLKGTGLNVVHTFYGVCFWDDKYSDKEARERLMMSLHGSMGELVNHIGDVDCVYMTIQPSDDCYKNTAVEGIKNILARDETVQACGFVKGYICDYKTLEVREYNPDTNPPFFTIKFTKEVFINPLRHAEHTGPYKSHEYVVNFLKYAHIQARGFMVGTHGENISTVFNHPYAGSKVDGVLEEFGIGEEKLKIKTSLRKVILHKFSPRVQKKLRYIFGEKIWNKLYKFLRN